MILDIRYFGDDRPEQLQGVEMHTVYTARDGMSEPVIVIHFQEYTKPSRQIALRTIKTIQSTND